MKESWNSKHSAQSILTSIKGFLLKIKIFQKNLVKLAIGKPLISKTKSILPGSSCQEPKPIDRTNDANQKEVQKEKNESVGHN
jgi:hypothetical protein